jgi:outer membrane immunogenic protein
MTLNKFAGATVLAGAVLAVISAAQAADMPVKAIRPIVPEVFSWTGFYIGANVGGAWSPNRGGSDYGPLFPPFAVLPPITTVFTVIPGQLDVLSGSGRSTGVIGGGQAGYNWQFNQVVLGVEADAVGSGLKGSTASASRSFGPPILPVTVTQTVTADFGRIDWMASFRGRLGFAADRVLFYVTGGAAVAGINGGTVTVVNGPGIGLPAGSFSSGGGGSTTRWGWTAGGGIEWAFANQWSLAGEYRHSDFGTRGVAFAVPDGLPGGGVFATVTSSSRLTVDQVTARLNYRFSAGPVVARY